MTFNGQVYAPGTYTKPLSEDFTSDGPKLRRFIELFWKTDDGKPFCLDEWQADLIDAVLERYPDDWHDAKKAGTLRYRQVLVSLGRQNGKSVLGAVFGMYGLMMHEPGPYVVGLASNADQATIIYNRVKFVIDNSEHLSKRFKSTSTRGLARLDKPGTYKVKPAKGDALQGIPVTMCLYDEVHITPPEMWSAMVLGTSAKDNGMVLGITTAGDDNSVLLKSLYENGKKAAAGDDTLEDFGFFLWEAPAEAKVDDVDALMAANPALACGRLDLDVVLSQVRTLPEHEARRYRLNQFVGSESSWLPMHLWGQALTDTPLPPGPVVFSVDRTHSWEHATITACVKVDGTVYAKPIAFINKPNLEQLLNVCLSLGKHGPVAFAMESYMLKDLGEELKKRGYPVQVLSGRDIATACSTAYALLAQGKAKVTSAPVLNQQMPMAVRKNSGEGWRINRASSSVAIDAVMSLVLGLYASNVTRHEGIPIY